MKTIKNLIPILVLLVLSQYGFQYYTAIPQVIINAVIFLPLVLSLMVISLGAHFNRSHIFFYSLLVILVNVILGLSLAKSALAHALLSLLIPLSHLIITLLPDRGIFSLKAIPSYATVTFTIILLILISSLSPEWISHLLLTDWLPKRYFDWTLQSQSVLFFEFIILITMLVIYFLKPSPQTSVGLGVLITLIKQLHFGAEDRSLNVFSNTALLMCLYGVLQESWRMAYLDELTELPARRALREKFQKIGGLYAVAMLDVDHFKKFNDTYGHDIGDSVLRMIATKMNAVTGGGKAYRYGGEEFTLIFKGKNTDEAIPHLEHLRETIANTPFIVNRTSSRRKDDKKPKLANNQPVNVTVSIGVSDSRQKARSPWNILKRADRALYRAKEKGRNKVCI